MDIKHIMNNKDWWELNCLGIVWCNCGSIGQFDMNVLYFKIKPIHMINVGICNRGGSRIVHAWMPRWIGFAILANNEVR